MTTMNDKNNILTQQYKNIYEFPKKEAKLNLSTLYDTIQNPESHHASI